METPTSSIQDSTPKIPQETMVTLQFPEILKKTFRIYILIILSLSIVTAFLFRGSGPGGIDGIVVLVVIVIFLSFVTGCIGIINCLRYKQNLTTGQKIIGWGFSLLALTSVVPMVLSALTFFAVSMLI